MNYESYDVPGNKWHRPAMKNYHMMCCDCSLVHVVDFRIRYVDEGNDVVRVVEMRARRDEKATKAMRKRIGKR